MIPFLDLARIHDPLKAEMLGAIGVLIDKNEFVLGESVETFEKNFAAYCGQEFAVSVNSGTSALHLTLLALGIGPGDEVIVPAMTFIATAAAVSYTGAIPKFVDVDPETWNIDANKIEAAITSRTRCIMPVHLHGLMADMPRIMEIATAHKLFVVEDAAQAHGSSIDGQRPGTFGDAACFSFYPGKNLGAIGEGGAVVTKNHQLAERVKLLRNWGSKNKYVHEVVAYNNRLESVQAAVLTIKLKHLDAWTLQRQEASVFYEELLVGSQFKTCTPMEGFVHVRHIYAVRSLHRQRTTDALDASRIGWGIHYPIPLHLQPAYLDLGHRRGDFPVSEALGDEWVSLPMFPGIRRDEIETIVQVLKNSQE